MKLKIPDISESLYEEANLEKTMESLSGNPIDQFPWGSIDPKPHVQYKIAHNNQAIFIHYDVWETEVQARYSKHNDPVHKDSCIEFFVAFENEQNYYNFEFNFLGTCYAAWGPDRYNRQLLSIETIEQIQIQTRINRVIKEGLPPINWQLLLKFPLNVFSYTKLETLKARKATANFYKCGDDLLVPHFIAWNPIQAETPNFHLSSFFGEVEFL